MDSGSSSRTSSAIERSDTPYSHQNAKSVDTQSGRLPEIVIKCQRCNDYLYVHLWPNHRLVHKALDLFGYTDKGQLKDISELTERRLRLLGKPIPTKLKPSRKTSSIPVPAEAPPKPCPQKAALVDRMFDVLRLGLLEDYHILLMQKVAASIPLMDDRIVIIIQTSIPFISGLAVASTDPEFASKEHQRPTPVDYPTSGCLVSSSIPFVQDYFGGHFRIDRRALDLIETPESNLQSTEPNPEGESEHSKQEAFPFTDLRSPPTVSVVTCDSLLIGTFDALGGAAAARCIARELPFRFLMGLNANEQGDTCSCVLNMFDARPSTEEPAGRFPTSYSTISTPRIGSPEFSFSDDSGVGKQERFGVFEEENQPSSLHAYLTARRPMRHACDRLVELANNVMLPQLRSGGSLWHVCGDTLDAHAEAHAERASREENEKRASQANNDTRKEAADWAHVKDSFVRSFHYADFMSSRGESERARSTWSACSLACALIRARSPDYHWSQMRDKIKSSQPHSKDERTVIGDVFVANTGSTRVLLIRGDKAIELTKPHLLPSDENMPASVEKHFALTRALGLHGAPELKRSMSATPHQTRVALDEHCAVLLIASEALFRALEPDHVGSLVHEQMKQFVRKLNIRREREKQNKLRAEKKAAKAAEEAARPVSASTSSRPTTSSTSDSRDAERHKRRHHRNRHRRRHHRDADDSQSASLTASRASSSYSRASDSTGATSRTGGESGSGSESDSSASSDEEDAAEAARDELGLESMLSEYAEIDKVPPARLRQEVARHLADRLYCAARMTGSWGPLSVIVALLPAIEYYLKQF